MSRRAKSVVSLVILTGAVVLVPGSGTPAAAQVIPAAAPAPSADAAKWEIEAHVGGAFGKQPTSGTPIGAFPAGDPFTFAGVPGRYASTWYFGDGTRLINQIAAGFTGTTAATTRVTALDPVLTASSLERKRGAGVGVRVGRRLTRIVRAEFGIDTMAGSLNMTDTALKGIEATRASFAPMWNAILATGPTFFLSRNVSSNATLTERANSRQTLLTGAATFELPSNGRIIPYATAGGGVLLRSGGLPSATLTGNYQFRIVDIFPFNESDVVRVHFAAKERVPVGLFGGGVKYALSARHGLRADVRVHVSANSIDTLVDARPSVVPGTPTTIAFAAFSGTTPPLLLSNSSSPRSNLTGPAIGDLKTFTGSGTDIQTSLTVGYFIRFPAAPTTRAVRAPRAPAPVVNGAKWEVEAHVGGGFGNQPTGGTPISAFPAGESFTTTGFLPRQSRYASTWYFGDGAVLLNQLGTAFGGFLLSGTKVTPLDPVLTTASLERKRGVSVGGRLSRRFTRVVSGEFGVESTAQSVKMTDAALAGLEATRASFTPMWNALLATGISLFLSPVVTSTSTLPEETDSRQTLVTGAANFELPLNGRVVPYATVGGGVLIRSGDLPTATLNGNYQFRYGGLPGLGGQFNASDVVTIHFATKDRVPVGLFGGGVKYALSARQGLRADVRVHISTNSLDTLADARPSSVTGTPAFSINSGTTPSLVFSNTSAPRANLSGPPITDLKTFTGSGRDVQTNLTIGYFVRF